jgi:hypothetical protein
MEDNMAKQTQHTPKPKLTKAQRIALEAARDFGSPNAYACDKNPRGFTVHPYRASRFAMFNALKDRGLLEGPWGCYSLTEAGRAAIAKVTGK